MNRYRIGILLNILIMISSLAGLFMVRHFGLSMLFYYTQDSNILAVIASALYLMKHRNAHLWRYAAFVCLNVTFLVVLFVLIPIMGNPRFMLFGGGMLFHHTLSPILSCISFLFFEEGEPLSSKDLKYGIIPTIIYGAIVLMLNILRIKSGPYPFFYVYRQPVFMTILWLAGIIAGTALIAEAGRRFRNYISEAVHG